MCKPNSKLLLAVALALSSPILARAQTTVPSTYVLPSSAADTTKPGFVWRFHQVASGQPNTLARTESQLAGEVGNNVGDPAAQGIALAPGVTPSPITAPITFELSGVLNLDKAGGGFGNFSPDDQMPGLPGLGGGTDNTAAEALTYLDLPAGTNQMGVNSDDGFRVTIGGAAPQDLFNAVTLGSYDGGRGAGDSLFTFVVPQAGLYAARMIWENGGGDANVEWFTIAADGTTKVLINDSATPGSIKAYRAVTSPATKAYVKAALPGKGATGVAPNAIIKAELADGPSAVDPTTVKLWLDGTQLPVNATKSAGVSTISYTPNPIYVSGSPHAVALTYTENGGSVTQAWTFAVQVYATIPPTAKVTADTTKPGFVWNVFANSANTVNSTARTEAALNGLLLDTTATPPTPLPNLADPAAVGAALAAASAPNPANATIHFEIPGVINLTQDSVGENANGNFTNDVQMPGIPPTDGIADGIAAEIITYVNLPAGLVSMGIKSDDGFKTTVGVDVTSAVSAGEVEGGPADTIFNFLVQEAGVYPLRTIYEEGGGGANIEWFSLKADGSKVLLNDTANGGYNAYRALTGTVNPYVKFISPGTSPRQLNSVSTSVIIVLADGTNPVDINSIVLKIDGQPVTSVNVREGNTVKVTYTPTTLQIPSEIHNADLTFKDSTGAFTGTRQWTFRNLKSLWFPTAKITENFDSYAEDTQPTGWVAWNFTAHCEDGRDITSQNSESYENWVLVNTNNAPSIDGNSLNVAPGQFFNGVPVETISAGNILYAESDSRCNNETPANPAKVGQTQFIITKPFDCSLITNVVMSISVLYEQNQDSMGAIEYSVDGGNNWLPVVIYLDIIDSGGDVKYNTDGTVNAVATLTAPNSDTSHWITNGVSKGGGFGGYGDGLATPITAALGDYVAPRLNDDSSEGARIEVFRLTQAGKKADVRLRFAAMGTDSWWFAVDNIAFYDVAPSAVPTAPQFNPPSITGNSVTLSWTGTGVLEESNTPSGGWGAAPSQNNPQTVTATGNKFYRIRQ